MRLFGVLDVKKKKYANMHVVFLFKLILISNNINKITPKDNNEHFLKPKNQIKYFKNRDIKLNNLNKKKNLK